MALTKVQTVAASTIAGLPSQRNKKSAVGKEGGNLSGGYRRRKQSSDLPRKDKTAEGRETHRGSTRSALRPMQHRRRTGRYPARSAVAAGLPRSNSHRSGDNRFALRNIASAAGVSRTGSSETRTKLARDRTSPGSEALISLRCSTVRAQVPSQDVKNMAIARGRPRRSARRRLRAGVGYPVRRSSPEWRACARDHGSREDPGTGEGNRTIFTYNCTAARWRSLAVGAWAAVLIGGELRGDRSGWAIVRIAGQGDGQVQWFKVRILLD